MDLFEDDKLIRFAIFFLPGFMSLSVHGLLVAGERRDFSKSLYEVLGYSALNYGFWSWLIYLVVKWNWYQTCPIGFSFALFLVMVASPILLPILTLWLLRTKKISKYVVNPIKKPWDYIFSKREHYWMLIRLKDGKAIGGRYGSNSFASSYPLADQIYLEEVWELDDTNKFLKTVKGSKGILVDSTNILAIEFFEI